MPSTEAVLSILRRLERRHFSRDVYARMLDADVTGEVLTVVAWQGGPPPADPERVIAHRTDLRQRLTECRGDLEAVLMAALQFGVYEQSPAGRPPAGDEPARLLAKYPKATWYE
ncbi:hypothetical protein M3A82_004615 [Micrococcus luteus]|uniref:Uncharacterized protein n=1 Tax=Micrococcus luteus TaxID=1270 RepID=A0AAP3AIB2_MICLU|nr:hypothetical protein [Micrococcus luteus]